MWISQSNLNAGNKHLIAGYFKHFFTNNHVNFYSVEQLNFKRDTIDFLVSLPWALRNKTVHNEEFTFNVKSFNCLSISLFCCTTNVSLDVSEDVWIKIFISIQESHVSHKYNTKFHDNGNLNCSVSFVFFL